MLSQTQFYDLIITLQKSSLTATQVILLSIGMILVTMILNYFFVKYTEKAKIHANNDNYANLKQQLIENTSAIKDIDKKISSELWVSQQIWQKKYELYDNIYTQLLSIKKWVDNESLKVDLHLWPEVIESNYQPYFTPEQEKQFYEELKDAKDRLKENTDDKKAQELNKNLQEVMAKAMIFLTEVMITKTIILSPNVNEALKMLIKEIGINPAPQEYEDLDDYEKRITGTINKVIETIRIQALKELQIQH